MINQWYYAHDNHKLGPFTAVQLRSLADLGQILLTDTIWKNEIVKGMLASKVKHLFSPIDAEAAPLIVRAPAAGEIQAAAPGNLPPATIPDDPPLVADTIPTPTPAAPPPPKVRIRRAIGLRGAIIVGQDGTRVKFRKKCTTCRHEDSSWTTMTITTGIMNAAFFCPKCRKNREVALQGSQT